MAEAKALLCYGVGGWILFSLILYYVSDGYLDAADSLGMSAVGGIFILLLAFFGIKRLLFALFGLESDGYCDGRSSRGGSSYSGRSGRGGSSGGGGSSRGF